MKKNEMKKLEELEQQKKLKEDEKQVLLNKIFDNLLIATNIVLLILIFLFARKFLNRENAELLYKISSIVFGILTITLFEISYRKQNKTLAVHGIEMFFLSITILFMPYMFYENTENWKLLIGIYAFIYYIIKIIVIYYKQKNMHMKEINDIQEIVKKESPDNINKERIAKLKEDNENKPKKRRGRPKKTENSNNQKAKKEENANEPKKKRGRPKKTENNINQKLENIDKPKRGRPKKQEVKTVEKRKRGRPKKEETL